MFRVDKGASGASTPRQPNADPTVPDGFDKSSAEVHEWYHGLRAFILALGDDIEERVLPGYFAFRRLKTFAYFSFQHTKNRLALEVPLPPGSVPTEPGFVEDKPRGYVRVLIDSAEDAERAQAIVTLGYQNS